MKSNVIEAIKKNKIIAIMRQIPKDLEIQLAQAAYDGGIRLIEVTFDQSDPDANVNTADSIKNLTTYFGNNLFIGAGTVLTTEQVDIAFAAGAQYIISPNTDQRIIKRSNELGIVSIPGAMSPSEIVAAHQNGADFIKIFPAGELGIGYIKAILAPLRHIPFLAVGGIDQDNMQAFINVGMAGIAVGSNLFQPNLLLKKDFAAVKEIAQKYTNQI